MTVTEYEQYFKSTYHHTSSFLSGGMLLIVDAVALFLSIGSSFFIINMIDNSFINFRSFVSYSIYLPIILAVFYAARLYPGIMIAPAEEVKRLTVSTFFSFMGIALSIIVEDMEDKVAIVIAFVLAVPIAAFLLPTAREVARRFFGKFRWWGVPTAIYCTGNNCDAIIERLKKRPDLGNRPALIIDSQAAAPAAYAGIPVFPPGQDIEALIRTLNIKVAILCDYAGEIDDIVLNYRYTITISREHNTFTSSTQIRDFAGIIGLSSTHHLTRKSNLFFRRVLELLLLLILSPFVLPLMLIITVLIKLTSPGPVFYGHTRIGKNRKAITCWKFRSMYVDADQQLERILATDTTMREEWERDRKLQNDPRVTPLGKFLRKTSLDELPQLWNVVIGNMGFIGPRPVTQDELTRYGSKVNSILSVTPGISGMWQISGRSDTGYEERVTLDLYYIQNWSIWLDVWIGIKTVWVVFSGKGAY